MKNRNNYPDNWEDTIRPHVLKRDQYKCRDCGLIHKSKGYYNGNKEFIVCDDFMIEWAKKHGYKIQKISLQIAHLDQDPSNNEYINLESKCPKCHLKFDEPYNKAKRLMRKKPKTIQEQ